MQQADDEWADGEDRLPNHHGAWAELYDPARVLADIASKRRIVQTWERRWEEAEEAANSSDPHMRGLHAMFASQATGLNTALHLLAMPYAEHPDYGEDRWP